MIDKIPLTNTGQVGNNTHAGVPTDVTWDGIAFLFTVEVAGATPTVTWKIQGALEDPRLVNDASATWFDVGYVTDGSDTISQSTLTSTAVGGKVVFLSNPVARKYQRFRVVTSANTNITYHVDAYRIRR